MNSGDVEKIEDVSLIGRYQQFYRSQGNLYGRFPLSDFVTNVGVKELVDVAVPIWGTKEKLPASQIFVTPMYLTKPVSGLEIGVEYEVPVARGGGFFLSLPPGGYHIRCEFEGLLEPSSDPDPRKG